MSDTRLVHSWQSNIPNEDKEWKLTLKQGDTDLSWLYVLIRKMRIGTAKVKIGGILSVRTEEAYRLKGYSTRVMNSALDRMKAERYGISVLLGIKDFYHRFGYAPVMANSNLFVKTKDLLRSIPAMKISRMRKSDGQKVAQLYNLLNATRTGTIIRPKYWSYFEGNFRILRGIPKPTRILLAHEKQGSISGYAALAYNEERYVVSEIGGHNAATFQTLAASLGRSAQSVGADIVEFRLPFDHSFSNFCSSLGCNWEIEYPRNHGIMARIIDLQTLFNNLKKELTRRVQRSKLPTQISIVFETDIGSICISIHPSSVHVANEQSQNATRVKIPQMRLIQLIMGYKSAEEITVEPDVSIPHSILPILSILFPKTVAYIWWSDRF